MESVKEVKIGQFDYQIGRFSPRVGNWLVSQFLTTTLLLQIEDPSREITEKDLASGLSLALRGLPEDVFFRVQTYALEVCRRVGSANTVTPILMKDGRIGIDPPPNPVETLVLTGASLAFNLHCFFEPGALEMLHLIFPDLSTPPSKPGSADTSSVQS